MFRPCRCPVTTRACEPMRALLACAALSVMLACQEASERDAADGGALWHTPEVHYPTQDSDAPFLLSQTGLYRDIATKQLAPDLLEYEPRYELWSDDAEKSRWLRLPKHSQIDSSDMDHWSFPIGTMLFKEFRAQDGRRLETRLVARTGPGPDDYFMGAFAWREREDDAVYVRMGARDVRETDHDIPSADRCSTCHNGEPGRVLGYSAIQQPGAAAPLSDALPEPAVLTDDLTQRALGYLHANCGNCHNERGTSRPDTNVILRLSIHERSLEDSALYRTNIGVTLDSWMRKGFALRIDPGHPNESAILVRMKSRAKADAMPPFASKHVDDTGVALIAQWIASLGADLR